MTALELIEIIRSGNNASQAQGELYSLVRQAVLSHLQHKIPPAIRRRLDAEDVLQEAFTRGLRAIDRSKFDTEKAFYAWVYRIAKNFIADQFKRQSVLAVPFGDDDRKGPRASQIVGRRRRAETQIQREDSVEALLGQLKPKEAEVIRLHQLKGNSFEEIAALWSTTPGAVQRFYSRAWQKLCALAQRKSTSSGT
jgi:RNA polymerase sigma factor (sigma-70 family)